jgi:hypothetical protein
MIGFYVVVGGLSLALVSFRVTWSIGRIRKAAAKPSNVK